MPRVKNGTAVTTDIDKGYKRILKDIKALKDKPYVKVGIQSDAGNSDNGTPLVLVASANEFGTQDGHIPSRSFIRSTMDEERGKFVSLSRSSLGRVLLGNLSLTQALNVIGLAISKAIQRKITALRAPANAPATIRAKGSDNPLVDTGQMRASIRHEVVMKDTGS